MFEAEGYRQESRHRNKKDGFEREHEKRDSLRYETVNIFFEVRFGWLAFIFWFYIKFMKTIFEIFWASSNNFNLPIAIAKLLLSFGWILPGLGISFFHFECKNNIGRKIKENLEILL